jgi:DNA primase
VRGHGDTPSLRETVLVMTVANHPQMLHEDFDELSTLEFEDKGLMRIWQVMLDAASAGGRFDRERLFAALEADGQADLIARLESQVRNARIWTATVEAAAEDAREGYSQALALHKRTRDLKWQKAELERDIVDCEDADAELWRSSATAASRCNSRSPGWKIRRPLSMALGCSLAGSRVAGGQTG